MIKVGITGQSGFVGTHLFNTLGLYPDKFERISFDDTFFQNETILKEFIQQCDAIVHLAAMNRHNDPEVIFKTNIGLVKQMLTVCEASASSPHIIFSSSIQEDNANFYGKSKKAGRELLADWAKKNGSLFTGLIFPNIFGPFGSPYYNSFIATFSHQLCHKETPVIEIDKQVPLLYVAEAVKTIIDAILEKKNIREYRINHSIEIKVSDTLNLLKSFKSTYVEQGIIPAFNDPFEINLFNTFRCYMDIRNHFPVKYFQHKDYRGDFVEIIKQYEGGQVSFSTTKPGITRGNHFHSRKIERFAVIKGKALIRLRRIGTNDVLDFYLTGEEPAYVDMPVWHTHNITNIGEDDLYTIFWTNEFFNPDDPDTFIEKV